MKLKYSQSNIKVRIQKTTHKNHDIWISLLNVRDFAMPLILISLLFCTFLDVHCLNNNIIEVIFLKTSIFN